MLGHLVEVTQLALEHGDWDHWNNGKKRRIFQISKPGKRVRSRFRKLTSGVSVGVDGLLLLPLLLLDGVEPELLVHQLLGEAPVQTGSDRHPGQTGTGNGTGNAAPGDPALLPLDRGGELGEPEGELPLEGRGGGDLVGRASELLVEPAEGGLPLQHEVGGVWARDGVRVLDGRDGRRAGRGFDALERERKNANLALQVGFRMRDCGELIEHCGGGVCIRVTFGTFLVNTNDCSLTSLFSARLQSLFLVP